MGRKPSALPAHLHLQRSSKAPGKPGVPLPGTLTTTTWSSSWKDSKKAGVPQEKYSLKCVAKKKPCTAVAAGKAATGIKRGTKKGMVTGLKAGTSYSCYVIATNSVRSVCSGRRDITTTKTTTSSCKDVCTRCKSAWNDATCKPCRCIRIKTTPKVCMDGVVAHMAM